MTTITALPAAPNRATDDAATFSSKADTFVAALQTFRTETNLVAAETNVANDSAVAASAAATSVSGATAWAGTTVSYVLGNATYSGVNFQTYRLKIASKAANVANTDPSVDTASWALVNGTGDVRTTTAQTLTNKTLASPIVTGVVSNALGAVAAPSYSFTGDLNTGAWSPSADAYAISTGGLERFRLDASGNAGIGTAAPAAKLEVASGKVVLSNTQSYAIKSNIGAVVDVVTLTSGNVLQLGGGGATDSIQFWNQGLERARITTSGDVVVGGTTAVEKVTLNQGNYYALRTGGAKLRLADQFNEVTFESVPVGSSSDAIFKTSALERMRLDQNGNLALGVVPSAWGSNYKAIESGANIAAVIAAANVNGITIASNTYNDNTNWRYKTTGAAARYSVNTGVHQWFNAPSGTAGNAITFTQAMTLDASGRLLFGSIGGLGQTQRVQADGDYLSYGDNKGLRLLNTASNGGGLISSNTGASGGITLGSDSGPMLFSAGGSERARIDSSGNLLVGTTSAFTADCKLYAKNSTQAQYVSYLWNATTTGDAQFIGFGTEAGVTSRGAIDYNRAGGLTRYNTTSDYRAKDIIGPVQDSGATIDALKVYEGQMKGATQSRPMLVAHEAQEHAPYAVSGVKDEVNEDGSPKFQQIDVSSLVPLLLAEIQSLRARVAALEA